MIRKSLCLLAVSTVLSPILSSVANAQVVTFGGNSERQCSNVMFFDRGAQKFLGGFNFTYGTANWKAEYEKYLNNPSDQTFRFGSGDWATLDTSLAMNFGGVQVPAGQYYLAFATKGGKVHLALLDPTECRQHKLPSSMPGHVEAKAMIPLTHKKTETSTDKLEITVKKDSFLLVWGPHALTADISVKVTAGKKNKGDAK